MTGYTLKPMTLDDLTTLYPQMRDDFPPNELPPRAAFIDLLSKGTQTGWLMLDAGGLECAYVLCARTQRALLITHLAVKPDFRGKGMGTELLRLLDACYADAQYMIVEVERPDDTADPVERSVRQRRIAFYERAGYVGYDDLPYTIWHVPMRLMAKGNPGRELPDADQIKDDIRALYTFLLRPQDQHKVEI